MDIEVLANEIKHLTRAVIDLQIDVKKINEDRWTWRGIIIAISTIVSWMMSK